MYILLTAATSFEIDPTLAILEKNEFNFNDHEIDILITGIGQAAATYLLTYNIQNKRPDLVIQAGIAGSFGNGVLLEQTVLVKQEAFGDLGMEEKAIFTSVFDAGFANKNNHPFTDGWLINEHPLLDNTALQIVKGVTVNKVSDSSVQKQQLINCFAPQIETMEGAALHYVCLQENVPFIQVRSISNAVGERDKGKWKTTEAIGNLNRELQYLISTL